MSRSRILSVTLWCSFALVLCLMQDGYQVTAQQTGAFATVSAASYRPDSIAPETIVAGFGANLATTTESGRDSDPSTPGIQLPTTIAGTTVRVNNVAVPLFFISPGQINYLIPANTPLGNVNVEVTAPNNVRATGVINVRQIAPAVFTANADGLGVPASIALRVAANGAQTYESIFARNTQANRFLATPINLGPEGEKVFLILFLSGIRRVPDPNNDGNVNEFTRVIINGLPIVPAYAGAQGGFVGLDQINVEIPRSLLGSAALDVQIVVPGLGVSNVTGVELVAPPVTNLTFRALGLPNRTIRSFATIGSYLFAATNLGVWCSSDSGANWINVSNGLPTNADVRTLWVDGTTLYAGLYGGGGVCVSTNNGQSWTALNTGLSNLTLNISNLLFFNSVLYAATQGGVCVYRNGSWTAVNNGLSNLDAATLLVYGGRLCVGTRGGGIFILGSGSTWSGLSNGLPSGAQVLTLVDAGAAVYAGLNGGGLCVSRNGGQTWTQVAGGFPASAVVNSIWIDGTRCYVATGTGIYVTNDSGVTWNPLNNGLAGCSGANNTNVVRAIASRLLAGSTGCGVYGSALAAGTTNRRPVAYEQSLAFTEDSPLAITLSAFDADLDPLTYNIVTRPLRGTLTGTGANQTYTPNANFNGRDSFTFLANDGRQSSTTTTIYLEGRPINDAPLLTVPGPQTVTVNQALNFTVSATDPDAGQTVTLGATGLPQGATFNATTGAFSWTPTVAGAYTLTFTATDNGTPPLLASKTVSVTVNPPQANRAPTAFSQGVRTNEDQSTPITLTGSDPDNDPLTFIIVNQPTRGVLTGTAPNLTYTPNPNVNGTDRFDFKVNDGKVDSPTTPIGITISAINDAPSLVVPGTLNVTAGQNVNFVLDVVDPDRAEQTYTYTSTNLPQGATLTASQDRKTATFNWTPGTNGTTTISFTVSDSGTGGLSDTKQVTIIASGPSPIGNWISLRGNLPKINNFDSTVRNLEAIGDRLFVGTDAGVFTSNFVNGVWDANWVAINNGIDVSDRNIAFLTVVGTKLFVCSTSGKLYASENNGTSWAAVNLGLANTNGLQTFFVKSFNNKLYIGTIYGLQLSTDNGLTWSLPFTNFTSPAFNFLPLENVFYALTNAAPSVRRSDNGGATFTGLSSIIINKDGLTALGATLFGSSAGGTLPVGLYRSNNGGNSWTSLTTTAPFNTGVYLHSFGDLLFAVGSDGVYFSSDIGATWQKMSAGAAPTGSVVLSSSGNFVFSNQPAYTVMPNPATNTAPALTVPAAQTATVGEPMTFNVSATDANNGQTVTLSAGNLPLGSSFIAATGKFSWTPAVAGTYLVGFTALDNGTPALSQTKTVRITVAPPANPPNGFWQRSNTGLELAGNVFGFANAGNKLFAKTTNGVYRLEANEWQLFSTGLPAVTNTTPQARLVYDLAADGNNLYVLLTSGLYRSTDLGVNWTKISNTTLPQLSSNSYLLGVRGTTVLVVGQLGSGFFMRSTDGGVSFTAVGGTTTASFPNNLISVGNDFYVANYNGLLRTTNNGGSFSSVSTLLNGPAFNITANGQTLFEGSSYGDGVFRSTDNGATWTATSTTGFPSNQSVSTLHYGASFLFAGIYQSVFYSLNNGAEWRVMSDGDTPSRVEALHVFDGKLWAVAGTKSYGQPAFNSYNGVYVSPLPVISGNTPPTLTVNDSYNAATGTAINFTVTSSGPEAGQTVTLSAAGLPQGATFTAATGAFSWTPQAAGTYYASFTATDNGTPALNTTKTVTFNVTGGAVVGNWAAAGTGLPAGNSVRGFGAIGDIVFAATTSGLYKTTNNGAAWTKVTSGLTQTEASFYSVSNVNDTLYLGGLNEIYSSNDGGDSWTKLGTPGIFNAIVGVVGVGNTLVAMGDGSVAATSSRAFVSTNFGQTWTVSTTGIPTGSYKNIVLKGTSIFAGGSSFSNITDGVIRTDNNGSSWAASGTGLPTSGTSGPFYLVVKGTDVFAAAVNTGVWRSTNNGAGWSDASGTGLPVAQTTYKAMAANTTFVFAAGNQAVYFTTNNGTSWTTMSAGDAVQGASSLLIVGTRIYAATPTGVFVSPLPGSN